MARLCIDPSDSLELGKQREIQNKTKKSRHLFMLLQSSLGAKKITRERDFKITCLSKCSDWYISQLEYVGIGQYENYRPGT